MLLPDRTYVGGSRTGTVIRQAARAGLYAVVATSTWNASDAWTDGPARVASLTIDGNRRGGGNDATVGLMIEVHMLASLASPLLVVSHLVPLSVCNKRAAFCQSIL